MPPGEIEDQPYTEGTLTKLEIFQLYVRAWLPVFTSKANPHWKRLHLFDFFAGRGHDTQGNPGSPLRVLEEIQRCWPIAASKSLDISFTACDADSEKVSTLKAFVDEKKLAPPGLHFETLVGRFSETLPRCLPVLNDPDTACLALIDQYGFKHVDSNIFQILTECPTTDILFFISTHHLHRFTDVPEVKRYMDLGRASDYHFAHREVLKWYRSKVPHGREYYLAAFSFKKRNNIYSVIFGSSHPRGMEKFLEVAWKKDKLNGEADYDLNREGFDESAPFLPMMDMFSKPKKRDLFEADLESAIRSRAVSSERDMYIFCLEHGMLPGHAAPVIKKLKDIKALECDFRSPNRRSLKQGRTFRLI